jgi:hypothetical protein
MASAAPTHKEDSGTTEDVQHGVIKGTPTLLVTNEPGRPRQRRAETHDIRKRAPYRDLYGGK